MRKVIVHHFFQFLIVIAVIENNDILRIELHRETDKQNREGWIFVGKRSTGKTGLSERMVDIGISRGFLSSEIKITEEFLPVQVKRNPQSMKGFLFTKRLILRGDYLLLSPQEEKTNSRIKFSRKLQSKHLRLEGNKLNQLIAPDLNVIVRKFAEEASITDLIKDYRALEIKWRMIEKNINKAVKNKEMTCIWKQNSLVSLFSEIRDIDRIVTNHITNTKGILGSLKFLKDLPIEKSLPLPHFLLKSMSSSLSRIISLDNQGFITIDKTDVGWIIDINSGSRSKEEIIQAQFETNCKALEIIGREIRLRDMCGLILIDCINMKDEVKRLEAVDLMRKEVLNDWNKVRINNLSYEDILIVVRESRAAKVDLSFQMKSLLKILIEIEKNLGTNYKKVNERLGILQLTIFDRKLLNDFLEENLFEKILTRMKGSKFEFQLNFAEDTLRAEKFLISNRKCSREDSNL